MSRGETARGEPARGELRIYLGAAPGVGKTYAMLGEAHRRAERGADVVVAVVETHGRAQTAGLLDGLEMVPRRTVEHRGVALAEMDLDAVLARRPQVALVDELAHSNAPGSTNPFRWQDVQTLLDAGIDVLSTVNVQHLESLNDVVARITGTVQRETVPDDVVRRAEQVELVDITPEALRRRLSHGNVYRPEQVDAAMTNYFRAGNLTALRELALLWVADQVDTALARYRDEHHITATWEARERVVVSVTGGAESETLIRRASRIASRAGAELLVVHIVRGDGLAGAPPTAMGRIRRLADALGATTHTITGDDIPGALLDFARGVNATQLVLGTSRRSRWARILTEGVGARVVQNSGPIDVHLVTHDQAGSARAIPRRPRRRRLLGWAAAVAGPAAMTGVLLGLGQVATFASQGVLYFLVVLGVALLGGIPQAVLAAAFSGLLLNYFFTDPRYTFTVAQPDNLVTLLVLMVVAVAVAALVDTAARRTREAGAASREAELLTLFSSSVLRGADLSALLDRVRETYGQQAVSLLRREEDGRLTVAATTGPTGPVPVETADTSTELLDGAYHLTLRGPELSGRERRVLRSVAHQAVGLLQQAELARRADSAAGVAEGDRLRRALLSAVSHDLRTPLAAVKASVSSLRSTDVALAPEDADEILAGIETSTDQLAALVDNLLDSSRLAAGVLTPQAVPVSCEEVVQRTLLELRRTDRERIVIDGGNDVTGSTDDELVPAVLADPGLLERVVANLLTNALRYAGDDAAITVSAAELGGRVTLRIADTGHGLPRGSADHLFEPFQRLGDRDTSTGVGLGLAVARGFTEAMGGTLTAEDTPGGGLTMLVDLPAASAADWRGAAR
ncbi:sensor histidine kinase KdpD [Nakamurella flavida]|uniref:histidine kinase n=1 Tax=Nakamurella flavida TaxID=363630 RepID=A0A938YRL3_9ACTN|nr:sensor histidine kinase KdpD [Nakamurella flavida]MBM9477625.1 sensor histidine kinase KdpD [Nakamurella flavida]MDP9779174.1 two-component system sensor histidine kinase KdpD [Nakamurella flavida]